MVTTPPNHSDVSCESPNFSSNKEGGQNRKLLETLLFDHEYHFDSQEDMKKFKQDFPDKNTESLIEAHKILKPIMSELIENTIKYSISDQPIVFSYKKIDTVLYIKTSNYSNIFFDHGGRFGTIEEFLQGLDDINKTTKESIKEQWQMMLRNDTNGGELHDDGAKLHKLGGAGLGLLDIGRNVRRKNYSGEIFSWKASQQDNMVKIDLLLTIPLTTT